MPNPPYYEVICSDYKDARLDSGIVHNTPCCLYMSASWNMLSIIARPLTYREAVRGDTELIKADTAYIQPKN